MRLATCIIVLRNVRQYQLYDSNEDPGCTAAPFVEMYAKIYARREGSLLVQILPSDGSTQLPGDLSIGNLVFSSLQRHFSATLAQFAVFVCCSHLLRYYCFVFNTLRRLFLHFRVLAYK